MIDRHVLAITRPLVNGAARRLAERGISANQMTIGGFILGLLAALLIIWGKMQWALVPLLLNRLADGLDGALARHGLPTERGAFLDISLDFLFYAAVPLAFAWCNPAENALAAATLLAAFVGTGATFLAYAVMAEKRGDKSTAYPAKGFYYLGGLTEGFETVAGFVAMCLWPQHFALLAYVYAGLCAITIITRLVAGWQRFAG